MPPTAPIAEPGARARGTTLNPTNRFETLRYEAEAEAREEEPARDPRTRFLADPTRSILATNDSPDVGFDASLNPYRGCEHGCIYCYARPSHEYLGLSAGLDFETRILVKRDAPALLRRKLESPGWKPQVVALSGVTDAYQPVERRLGITRRCLEILLEFRNPVVIITKNHGVTRDLDLLQELAGHRLVSVSLSVTSLDPTLQKRMEPRTSPPSQRLAAIRSLAGGGVPVGVMVAPVIPGLTDHEIPSIVEAAAAAGAGHGATILLRLPHGVEELFSAWLAEHHPDRREKVLSRLRSLRGGRLDDPRFGTRMRGEGVFADQIQDLFRLACRSAGIADRGPSLETSGFRRPSDAQLDLFA